MNCVLHPELLITLFQIERIPILQVTLVPKFDRRGSLLEAGDLWNSCNLYQIIGENKQMVHERDMHHHHRNKIGFNEIFTTREHKQACHVQLQWPNELLYQIGQVCDSALFSWISVRHWKHNMFLSRQAGKDFDYIKAIMQSNSFWV